ncbi:MAG: N-acetyltransferase [Neisseriaceae bacterium]|nr:MAG: N-acetyltransferase [Neisseriaceae bacterium]
MTARIQKFEFSHLEQMEIQKNQEHVNNWLNPLDYVGLNGWTLFVDDKPIFCAGLFKMYGKRYVAWSLIAWNCGCYFRRIMRVINRYLRMFYQGCRIECTCDVNFKQAHRFAEMLGFKLEAPLMRQYEVDGRDSCLYAMIVGG